MTTYLGRTFRKAGLGSNIGKIAKDNIIFNITPRTVAKYSQISRETEDLTPKPLAGRTPILTNENLDIIKKIIVLNKDGTLQDFRDAFNVETSIYVAISTIQNACDKLDMNHKKKFLCARTRKRRCASKAVGFYRFSEKH